jgi:hypothetical protein
MAIEVFWKADSIVEKPWWGHVFCQLAAPGRAGQVAASGEISDNAQFGRDGAPCCH